MGSRADSPQVRIADHEPRAAVEQRLRGVGHRIDLTVRDVGDFLEQVERDIENLRVDEIRFDVADGALRSLRSDLRCQWRNGDQARRREHRTCHDVSTRSDVHDAIPLRVEKLNGT